MKKIITLIIVAALGFSAGKIAGKMSLSKQNHLPERFKLGKTGSASDGLQLIIKGILKIEVNRANQTHEFLLKIDTGDTYVLFNAPYLNALLMNKIEGKTVKIKGLYISKTKYKEYPGIYIQDILEVY
jgi:hypothetical protein